MMRAYDLLLRLYPASFRAEYGPEMRAIFARKRRDCSGPVAVTALWFGAILDVGGNAAGVQWDILRQDARHASRVLRRARGFTATAILLAALGTGATTAAFSIADHVLIRPVRFSEPDRLVRLWQDQSFRGYSQLELSPGNYRDWQRMSTAFAPRGAPRPACCAKGCAPGAQSARSACVPFSSCRRWQRRSCCSSAPACCCARSGACSTSIRDSAPRGC